MIRVGVCDDDPLVLRLVADVIGRADDLVVVAVCRSGDEAIAVDEPVDVWLMDQRMPEMTGIQACAVLTAGTDPPSVLILTASTSETVSEAYRSGASGYLFKDEQPERLHTAVRAAAAGFQVQSPQAAVIIPRSRDAASPRPRGETPELAADERRIAAEVMTGQTYAQIAPRVGMSQSGLKKRVAALMKRLDVHSRPQLMAKLRDLDLGR